LQTSSADARVLGGGVEETEVQWRGWSCTGLTPNNLSLFFALAEECLVTSDSGCGRCERTNCCRLVWLHDHDGAGREASLFVRSRMRTQKVVGCPPAHTSPTPIRVDACFNAGRSKQALRGLGWSATGQESWYAEVGSMSYATSVV
jgi:hypothetical protein